MRLSSAAATTGSSRPCTWLGQGGRVTWHAGHARRRPPARRGRGLPACRVGRIAAGLLRAGLLAPLHQVLRLDGRLLAQPFLEDPVARAVRSSLAAPGRPPQGSSPTGHAGCVPCGCQVVWGRARCRPEVAHASTPPARPGRGRPKRNPRGQACRCVTRSIARRAVDALSRQVGRADQRSPAKRSFSGMAAPVASWTRRKVSMPISSPNLSLPILRKKMFSP